MKRIEMVPDAMKSVEARSIHDGIEGSGGQLDGVWVTNPERPEQAVWREYALGAQERVIVVERIHSVEVWGRMEYVERGKRQADGMCGVDAQGLAIVLDAVADLATGEARVEPARIVEMEGKGGGK